MHDILTMKVNYISSSRFCLLHVHVRFSTGNESRPRSHWQNCSAKHSSTTFLPLPRLWAQVMLSLPSVCLQQGVLWGRKNLTANLNFAWLHHSLSTLRHWNRDESDESPMQYEVSSANSIRFHYYLSLLSPPPPCSLFMFSRPRFINLVYQSIWKMLSPMSLIGCSYHFLEHHQQ